jgi:hypothetical protein
MDAGNETLLQQLEGLQLKAFDCQFSSRIVSVKESCHV